MSTILLGRPFRGILYVIKPPSNLAASGFRGFAEDYARRERIPVLIVTDGPQMMWIRPDGRVVHSVGVPAPLAARA